MKHATRGRRPLPDDERRDTRFTMLLREDERRMLDEVAEEYGEDASSVVRTLVKREARKLGIKPRLRAERSH